MLSCCLGSQDGFHSIQITQTPCTQQFQEKKRLQKGLPWLALAVDQHRRMFLPLASRSATSPSWAQSLLQGSPVLGT